MTYGKIKIKLDELMVSRNISINKLSKLADMQRTQIKRYRDNTVTRLDTDVLARICTALDCSISDLLAFIPPEE